MISDVAVLPEYQRTGVGDRMMGEQLRRLPVWRVMLVAAEDVQGHYRRRGFERYPKVMARLDRTRLYDAPPDESVIVGRSLRGAC